MSALTAAQSLSRPHRPQQGIVIRAAVASPTRDSSLEVIMGESAKATLKASLERLLELIQLPTTRVELYPTQGDPRAAARQAKKSGV